jgi:hypothetical protein
MADSPSIWFHLGFALERARQDPPAKRLRGLMDLRARGGRPGPKDDEEASSRQRPEGTGADGHPEALDALLTTAAAALAGQMLRLLPARGAPGIVQVLRGGAAGAGAALLRELVDPLLHGRAALSPLGPQLGKALLSGAARGLLYGAVLDPRLPGPPAARGVVYGSVEYAVSPWGGLTTLLGERAPHRRLPFLVGLFEDYRLGEDRYLDHLAFGIALAVLYGSPGRASSGTTVVE